MKSGELPIQSFRNTEPSIIGILSFIKNDLDIFNDN